MNTQMNTPLNIKDHEASHGVSETTVRSPIRSAGIDDDLPRLGMIDHAPILIHMT